MSNQNYLIWQRTFLCKLTNCWIIIIIVIIIIIIMQIWLCYVPLTKSNQIYLNQTTKIRKIKKYPFVH